MNANVLWPALKDRPTIRRRSAALAARGVALWTAGAVLPLSVSEAMLRLLWVGSMASDPQSASQAGALQGSPMPRKKRKAQWLVRLASSLLWSAPFSVNGGSRPMVYRFADCELDAHLYQLRRSGAPVPVEPKVFDVLAYLLQHRDRVVSKDELLDKLWLGQVVGENALTRCIRAARAAVGDDGTKQAIIETQHGRGYRFIAPLTTITPPVSSSQFQVPSQEEGTSSQQATGESGLESSVQSLESKRQSRELSVQLSSLDKMQRNPGAERGSDSTELSDSRLSVTAPSWPSMNLALVAVLLLTGIALAVHYLSRPTLSTQSSELGTVPAPQALALPDKPSIIVLPFVNLSGDPAQEYFSDGMTEEITSALSRLSSLFVIARTSAFTYKGKAAKVQDISREMGVRYVLEGSARKTEGQVRIIAQLIDATTGEHLWSERYDRPLQDIFTVQEEIVQQLVTTLKLQLTLWEQGVLVRKRTHSLEAYDAYLRGVESMWRAAHEAKKELNAQAGQLFAQAIALDPQYADAYAGLAYAKYFDWFYLWSPEFTLEQARQAGKTAVALNDSLSMPHSILGLIYVWKKQHAPALVEAERAVVVAPSDADSYHYLGLILAFTGQPEKAISLIKQAIRLNPRSPSAYLGSLAIAYRVAGRCEEALTPLRRVLSLAPQFLQARVNLAICYVELERVPEAQAEVAEIQRINPGFSLAWMTQRLPYRDPAITERMVAALRKAGLK